MSGQLLESVMAKNPFRLFDIWFKEITNEFEARACSLATASKDGVPSCRMVMLREHSSEGFLIFTDAGSLKAQQMKENPRAELLFFWPKANRQVRVSGSVTSVSKEIAEKSWHMRTFDMQVPLLVGRQGDPAPSKQFILDKVEEVMKKYENKPVDMPENWGGFCVSPTTFDFSFWKPGELADRIRFCLKEGKDALGEMEHQAEDGWVFERLTP